MRTALIGDFRIEEQDDVVAFNLLFDSAIGQVSFERTDHASGAGCSASVFFSYMMEQFATGRFKRVLLVATGALLSPLSFQQGETIPCIAHAVEINIEEA